MARFDDVVIVAVIRLFATVSENSEELLCVWRGKWVFLAKLMFMLCRKGILCATFKTCGCKTSGVAAVRSGGDNMRSQGEVS